MTDEIMKLLRQEREAVLAELRWLVEPMLREILHQAVTWQGDGIATADKALLRIEAEAKRIREALGEGA